MMCNHTCTMILDYDGKVYIKVKLIIIILSYPENIYVIYIYI